MIILPDQALIPRPRTAIHPKDNKEEKGTQVENPKGKTDELEGKLAQTNEHNKLMRSVLEGDKDKVNEANILKESMNQSLSSFVPDMTFAQMTKNFSMAKKLYGPRLLRELTGYDPNYLEKNIKIPEFQRDIKKKLDDKFKQLKRDGLLDKDNKITDQGVELATLITYISEIEQLKPKGLYGQYLQKKRSHYGVSDDIKPFNRDRYRDIAVKQTVKTALRRGHSKLEFEDLRAFERKQKGSIHVVYALDSSGSMKGDKMDRCKKAGVALAYKGIQEKDHIGLLVFGDQVIKKINPTQDFKKLIRELVDIKASKETDLVSAIKESIDMFPETGATKHLILLTDAVPTKGDNPVEKTLEMAQLATHHDITISLVGINLDEKGEDLAQKIVDIGKGKLYVARDTDNIDQIVLEDYYGL